MYFPLYYVTWFITLSLGKANRFYEEEIMAVLSE